jgi:hypothetical protein
MVSFISSSAGYRSLDKKISGILLWRRRSAKYSNLLAISKSFWTKYAIRILDINVIGPNLLRLEWHIAKVSELQTILEENHHSFLIVERRAYEGARDIAGRISRP